LRRPIEIAAETGQAEATENQTFGNATNQELSNKNTQFHNLADLLGISLVVQKWS